VDTRDGHVVATAAIGKGPDATRYDAKRHLVFSPNGGDGTPTIFRQDSANRYTPGQTLTTQKGARTMALDSATGTVYLVTATEFGRRRLRPSAIRDRRPRPTVSLFWLPAQTRRFAARSG
jgi:hypothetical protein